MTATNHVSDGHKFTTMRLSLSTMWQSLSWFLVVIVWGSHCVGRAAAGFHKANVCLHCVYTVYIASSSWWRTPSRALPYWRLDAKYPFPLPSSKPCGPQSSGTERLPLSLSARWILVDQEVSANQVVVAEQRRWHGGGPPLELIEPGARKTSTGTTWPFQRLVKRWRDKTAKT